MNPVAEDILMHYGIKGMKWGIRRTPEELGHGPSKSRVTVNFTQSKADLIKKEVKKYENGGPAGNQNCELCTWSMECQFRGKNVLPRPVYSPRDVIFEKNGYDIVKNPVKESIKNEDDILRKIESAGEGSRFYTHVNWKGSNGGHEFIMTKIDSEIYVVDGQAGLVAPIHSEKARMYVEDINYSNSYLVRMDNKELNTDILKYNDREYLTEWEDEKDIPFLMNENMVHFSFKPVKNDILEDTLIHYGVKRRSGRYPWGSGDNPYQHSGDFLSRVEEFQKQGLSEKQIAEAIGLSTTDLRMQVRVAKHERRALEADRARSLRDDGLSLNEIAKKMGYANDSSIRSLLNENTAASKNRARATADILKKELETKGMIDVGAGAERYLGVSQNTLKEALFILETEGYNVYGIGIPQVTNKGKQINTPILTKPDTEYRDVYQNMGDIQSVGDFHSTDSGKTFTQLKYPASIDSNRVAIRYGDEGGLDKDGVIEIRRGVEDLDLGNSHYAQVRILVDGTHYLKGMAMYADDLPDGVDIMFNTNKKSGTDKMDVLKKIKEDPDNPFGAAIKANGQSIYIGEDGKEHLSAINKLKEEGDWDKMSKNLSSQFLSKQPIQLIKKQLDLTYKDSAAEFDEIMSLTNPTIKRKLLQDFADECDSAVVHLKAAALPRQTTQVILPITALKENEVYAPSYRDGEQIALIRYPHAGTFEIPVLKVNNRNQSAIDILGKDIQDAIGINPKVAERLSGADFDGDQVVAIPTNNRVKIKSSEALSDLKGFDPKTEYSTEGKTGVKLMTKSETQKQMGMVSNLITDMTIKGADESEIARAVKHSMVVIDAEKHKLDYKQSEKDNGIAELKKKYQGYTTEDGKEVGGASTLLSRRKQDVRVPERQGSGRIDPETGKVTYKESGRTYVDSKGKTVQATTKTKLLYETDDLRTLSSGHPVENAYADYGNKMKALANEARKAYLATGRLQYSSTAAQTYKTEVDRLQSALNVAAMNAPKERRAQAIANSQVKAKVQANPDMDKKEIKKASQIAINNARAMVGANGKETRITISDREWEAIQAGAISDSKLTQILRYADADAVRQKATPRSSTQLSAAKIAKLKAMSASGHTIAEIADALGVSRSVVSNNLNS